MAKVALWSLEIVAWTSKMNYFQFLRPMEIFSFIYYTPHFGRIFDMFVLALESWYPRAIEESRSNMLGKPKSIHSTTFYYVFSKFESALINASTFDTVRNWKKSSVDLFNSEG